MLRWDFSALMLLFVLVSGAIWALDVWWLAPRRKQRAGEAEEVAPPLLVDYAKSFFPVFLIVLVLRSFLIEPFRIPSNSMMPTLLTGDFIVVNKFSYGIRLPVFDTKIVDIGSPAHGDVVVFRYPKNPSTPYIKRIVGLPGDRIGYYNKILYVNGEPAAQAQVGIYHGFGSGTSMTGSNHKRETLGDITHDILIDRGSSRLATQEWVVPEGHYFVLGDNRDNSRDSRYWGFVPDNNLIGRAFAIWMHWDWGHGLVKFERIGNAID